MSTCTRTYLSTVTKKLCAHEYITSTTEYYLDFNLIGSKVNCISGLPSSVSNAPHLSFSDLKKKWPHLFISDAKIKRLSFLCLNEQKRCPIMLIK